MGDPLDYRWLETGDAFYQTVLSEIGSAHVTLRLETYIFSAGHPGDGVRDALTAAARRGVRVSVLLDAFGSLELPGDYWEALAAAGGECRLFHPLRSGRLIFRNHRKLLVADGAVALVGGFNITGVQVGDGVTRGWRDLGLRLAGGAAAELAASFDAMWALAAGEPRRRLRLPRWGGRKAAPLLAPVSVLSGRPGRRNAIRRALLDDFRQARDLRIISAYFLPSHLMRRALRRAARRGGTVQIITAGKTDVPLARHAGRALYERLLRKRIRLFEYEAQILHTKLMVCDHAVYIGSANLDNRSLQINYELLLRLEDERLATEARHLFAGYLPHCRAIDPATWASSRGWGARLLEIVAYWLLARLDSFLARRGLTYLR